MRLTLGATALLAFNIHCATVNEALWHLAHAWQAENNSEQAIATALKLLERDAKHIDALLLLGMEYYKQGNTSQALACFDRRLQTHPHCATTHLYSGMAHAVLNNIDCAISHYEQALTYDPTMAKTYGVLGIALEKKGLHDQAINIYEKGLEKDPNNHEVRMRLATLLKTQKKFESSLQHYDHLLQKNPHNVPCLQTKAELLVALGRIHEGLSLCDALVAAQPNNQKLILASAHLHAQAASYDRAYGLFEELMHKSTQQTSLHFEMSKLQLLQGKLENGFYHLHMSNESSGFIHKRLKDITTIPGSTILIGAEWLHEDMLHFVRFARILKEQGAFVIVQTPKALKPLLSLCPYIDRVLALEHKELCPFDFYIPLTSLPYLLRDIDTSLAHQTPYLFADKKLIERWKNTLPASPKLNIGLYLKSPIVPLQNLLEQLPIDTHLHIFYSPEGYNAVQNIPETRMIQCYGRGFDESLENMMHMAALISIMDVIITTDCTMAHLAGGLGKKTIVITDDNPLSHWRWMTKELCSLWYPTIYTTKDTMLSSLFKEIIAK